jgi:succinate-semialdehyde dehydrogenase/glutarate-semialdehyde dehydrogenase
MTAEPLTFLQQLDGMAGRVVEPGAGGSDVLEVMDPSYGEPVIGVNMDDAAAIAARIDRAEGAQRAWADRTAYERGEALLGVATRIRANIDDLAAIMTAETGKPLAESRGEWGGSAGVFEWCSEEGKRLYGRIVPARIPSRRIWVLKQPVGVVASITAWNFPAILPSRKWAAALAAGCAVLGRPSTRTPMSALALAGLAYEAGVPEDVLQVVIAPGSVAADAFINDHRVRILSFTGGEDTGMALVERGARTHTEVRLELGGSAPVVVLDDADPGKAAALSMAAKFRNAGQVCISPSRFLVADGVATDFVDAITARFDTLTVGPGAEEGTDVGPVIDAETVTRLEGVVEHAVNDGARLVRGGKPIDRKGTYFEPTLLDGVSNDDRISTDEIFGPVLPISHVSSTEEALALANDTRFGLAAYVHTQDLDRAVWFAERMQAGIIGVNDMIPATAEAPFGGWKDSGNAAEGGVEALLEYTRTKYVAIGTSEPS